jgi:hypothetical protein
MTGDHKPRPVPRIGNYYGGLSLKREGAVDYWSIENYAGDNWVAIPTYLGDALRKYVAETPADD